MPQEIRAQNDGETPIGLQCHGQQVRRTRRERSQRRVQRDVKRAVWKQRGNLCMFAFPDQTEKQLFLPFQVSWSKIIALFAFAARLAQHCDEQNQKTRVLDVASNLSQFAVEKITPFLRQHGGWVSQRVQKSQKDRTYKLVVPFKHAQLKIHNKTGL